MEKKRSRGRPKTGRTKKPLQIVLDPKVLGSLDIKAEKLKMNRSAAIQAAIVDWLGSGKKRKPFSNFYKEISLGHLIGQKKETQEYFETLVSTVDMPGTDAIINNKLLVILKKICKEVPLTVEETFFLDDSISKAKILVNDDFSYRSSTSHSLEEAILTLVILNRTYPIKNFFAVCKSCDKLFLKRRKNHQFDSNLCKLNHLKKRLQESKSQEEFHKVFNEIRKINKQIPEKIVVELPLALTRSGDNKIPHLKTITKALIQQAESSGKNLKTILSHPVTDKTFGKIGMSGMLMGASVFKYFQEEIISKNDLPTLEEITMDEAFRTISKDLFSFNEKTEKQSLKYFQSTITADCFSFFKDLAILFKKIDLGAKSTELLPQLQSALDYICNGFLIDFPLKTWSQKQMYGFYKGKMLSLLGFLKLDSPDTRAEGIRICKDVIKEIPLFSDARYGLVYGYFLDNEYALSIQQFQKATRVTSRLSLLKDIFLGTSTTIDGLRERGQSRDSRLMKEFMALPTVLPKRVIMLLAAQSYYHLEKFSSVISILKDNDIDYKDLAASRHFVFGLALVQLGDISGARVELAQLQLIDSDAAKKLEKTIHSASNESIEIKGGKENDHP